MKQWERSGGRMEVGTEECFRRDYIMEERMHGSQECEGAECFVCGRYNDCGQEVLAG